MGRRGTKTKPGKVVVFMAPTPEAAPPDKPAWITEDEAASAEWDRVVSDLVTMGIIMQMDGAAVEAYCIAYADWRRYSIMVRDLKGDVIIKAAKDPDSPYMQLHPLVALCRKSLQIMRALAAELGLNPSARTDIGKGGGAAGAGKSKTVDPLEEMLRGKE